MIYGLLFVIILIYCYEYWKMISKYKHLFFQDNNTIETLNNNQTDNESKIINKIKDTFSNTEQNCESCQFTPYNFTQLSNHAIDVSEYNETKSPTMNQEENIRLEFRNIEGKVLNFVNELTKNYTNIIAETLKEFENESLEEQQNIIKNLIKENQSNELPLINPNSIKKIFQVNNTKFYCLINSKIINSLILLLNENEANIAGKNNLTNFMEEIFDDVDKVKKDYQLTKLSNKDIWKKYLKKKPQFSKYYPNDSFKSKKFNEPHMYLNKPIHREDLPCKWKCQRSWFQCHYAIDK